MERVQPEIVFLEEMPSSLQPGLFDGNDSTKKEIEKCIEMAKDGIHAFLMVFSIRTRFSEEEQATFLTLLALFGDKIVNYMIVIFTGGDELDDNEETLDDYLGQECPKTLKDILILCDNRKVLFDNKSKNEKKQQGQIQQLLNLVDIVMSKNGGRPYTHQLFKELIKDKSRLKEESIHLSKNLEEERIARLKAEEDYESIKAAMNDEIEKLKRDLETTKTRPWRISCSIL
ncbi:hypothetical protein VNO78_12954 [Psophocarpus tetragonolobus]|uniref:AIG1-type G domain-containing protein n=1 Tax=Psophocarpus tetragonolobus TaxID=3891 RepID=A0AAN9XPV4_PSOTE